MTNNHSFQWWIQCPINPIHQTSGIVLQIRQRQPAALMPNISSEKYVNMSRWKTFYQTTRDTCFCESSTEHLLYCYGLYTNVEQPVQQWWTTTVTRLATVWRIAVWIASYQHQPGKDFFPQQYHDMFIVPSCQEAINNPRFQSQTLSSILEHVQ